MGPLMSLLNIQIKMRQRKLRFKKTHSKFSIYILITAEAKFVRIIRDVLLLHYKVMFSKSVQRHSKHLFPKAQ